MGLAGFQGRLRQPLIPALRAGVSVGSFQFKVEFVIRSQLQLDFELATENWKLPFPSSRLFFRGRVCVFTLFMLAVLAARGHVDRGRARIGVSAAAIVFWVVFFPSV